MPQTVNFTLADLYINTHPCSLSISSLTANLEPADLCNEAHPSSRGISNATVNLGPEIYTT